MRSIPFGFFVRVILLTASFVLAVFSMTTKLSGKEFVYAAGSIAAAMLASVFRKKRKRNGRPPGPPYQSGKVVKNSPALRLQ